MSGEDGEEDRARSSEKYRQRLRAQKFTFGELEDAIADLAGLRVDNELRRVAAAHDTAGHYELAEERDCGTVQNMLMGPPTELGHYPTLRDRLTATCAMAHLLETLWEAEKDLLKVEQEKAEDETEGDDED